jgi:hypothetical protein
MEVAKSKWLGVIVVAVKDSEGNRYNLETGQIDLSDGRHVIVPEAQRNDMTDAINRQIAFQSRKWFGWAASKILENTERFSPENIIGLAGKHLLAGEEWRQHLSATFTEKALDGMQTKIDTRTGALCVPSTLVNPIDPFELARTTIGNPSKFVCTPSYGPIYEVNSIADPTAGKHLAKPSEAKKSGGMEV